MKIRPMLRDPSFQQQLLAKPILERQAIALDARAESQAHTSQTKLAIMDVTPQAVRDAPAGAAVPDNDSWSHPSSV